MAGRKLAIDIIKKQKNTSKNTCNNHLIGSFFSKFQFRHLKDVIG